MSFKLLKIGRDALRRVRIGRAALAAAAFCVATVPAPSFAANQYWVGGANGPWDGANWADSAGGTGGAWTSGNTGWFTTSPSTIDLAGSSQSVTRFKTTGFSAANRCVVNITNSSDTASTLTFSGLNRNNDDDLAFTDLIIRNVAVSDSSTWGFEIFNGTHVYFGSGSSYTKPTANSNGSLYVGMFSATSNTITVAEGATMNVNGDAYIGCSRNETEVACIGVVHVADGTLNVPGVLYMARSTSNNKTKNAGTGALVVDDGGTVNVTGNIEIGSVYQKNHTHNGKADIIVNRGGVVNCAKFIAWEYANRGRKVCIDGGTFNCTGNFESGYASSGLYKSRSYTVEVKNGGVLALGGNFYPNSYNGAKETVTFDGGTFRALGNISTISSSAGDGDYTDFKIGAGGVTIDTQAKTINWTIRIDESEGKVTKTGSGKLNLNWTTYNSGGIDVDEGTLSFGGTDTRLWNGPLTIKGGATLEKQTGNNPSSLASSVTFKDGAKLSVPYSGGSVGAVSANAITLEGALEVSFSATPAAGAYPLLTILGEGTFDASALEDITLPDDPAFAGAVLSLSADAKSVVLILSSDPVWIGGTSGDLGVASNWSNGAVPGPTTNAIITAGAAATLTNSASFKATSITFPAGCPKVTIEGTPLEDMVAINNLSSANHEFKVAVTADTLTISNTTTYCVFSGGLTANSVSFEVPDNTKSAIYGVWHIKGDWHPVKGNRLYDGATVTVDGTLVDPDNLSISAGCTVTAAALYTSGSHNHIGYINEGRLVVTGQLKIEASEDCFLVREGQGGKATVEFGSYYANTPGKWARINAKNVIVGAGGMYCATQVHFVESPVLHSRAEGFSIDAANGICYSGDSAGVTTINTTQYGTEDVPATVTINAVYKKQSNTNPGAMTVTGCGTVLFNSVSTFSNGLTVTNTATVAVNPGMRPGDGTVTVRTNATLQVAQSGTVALNGGLTLDDGAALGFNFTEKRTAPVLDVTGKTVTLNGTVVVKISATEGIRPKGGNHTLTSGGKFAGATVSLAAGAPTWVKGVSVVDGEIVLNVKSTGMVIIVK